MKEKKEKKKKGRIWVPLLLLLLGLSVPGRVQAAGNGCELTIPVEIEAKGEHIPGKKEYQVALEAVTKDAPLPAERKKSRTGAGLVKLGPVSYEKVGTYQYRILQTTEETKGFTCDREKYLVTVQVTRLENQALTARLYVEREGKKEKAEAIRFSNQYCAPEQSSGAGSHRSTVRAVQTGDTKNPAGWLLAAGATALTGFGCLWSYMGSRRRKA
ncbi:Spy0128 family protein [Candidatus Merdisoma sp. HCP28S3_D10]|uniref:Spy0128 family protein n=1 Tax=unclassified Candidatus Merdisoma TaxID=3099611 RepID=UPI003F8C1E81